MDRRYSRRDFLKQLYSIGSTSALASLGLGHFINSAHADHHCVAGSWGQIVGNVGGWNCDNHDGVKVLEIFLFLGVSQWESLWLPGSGAPNFTDYDLSALPLADLDWTLNTADFPCESPDIPSLFSDSALFGPSNSGDIYWGAATKPLYRRNDIFSKCRMVTTFHDLLVHQLAERYVLTGLTLGNARSAGTGAAIQRRARVVDPNELLPVSWVFHQGESNALVPAVSIGTHPGSSRPVDIRISNNNAFVDSLSRTGISSESDSLLRSLRHEYRDRMRFLGAGDPVRSSGFSGYWSAAELLENAPLMQALFAGDILIRDDNVATCPEHPVAPNSNDNTGIKTMIGAAAELLANGPARYVCAIDSGISGTYDTHNTGGATPTTRNVNANLYNVFHHLAENIHDPVENPSGLIDLNDTMIVISTDFNRTPGVPRPDGRDHWPYGGITVFMGGPIIGGPSIEGGIDAAGYTEAAFQYSPTDIRAAILLAAGVDPFADGNFRVSDFSDAITVGVATEPEIRNRLKSQILGV